MPNIPNAFYVPPIEPFWYTQAIQQARLNPVYHPPSYLNLGGWKPPVRPLMPANEVYPSPSSCRVCGASH
jgi:hypothetical protein